MKQLVSWEKVWYAAYGSNLFPLRLNWYLHGGKTPTSDHWYTPCPDDTPIQARFSGRLPFRLYFARTSLIWAGAKGFIDTRPEPDKKMHAQAAFYLLNRAQFEHVVWQENWESMLPAPLQLRLEELPDAQLVTNGYLSDYSGLMYCGAARNPDGSDRETRYPVVSFTLEGGMNADELSVPSRPYLQHIAEGLRASFPLWDDKSVADYLWAAPGANALDRGEVLEAIKEHLHVEDPRMAEYPPPPLLAYQGGYGAEVVTWRKW